MIFNLLKTISLTKYLLEKNEGPMQYLKLIKLLYLCDREMLISYQHTITKDSYVSMKLGPVLSNTYSLIRDMDNEWLREHSTINASWSKIFQLEKYNISLKEDYKKYEGVWYVALSEEESSIADPISLIFQDLDGFEMAEYTHLYCPEWKDPAKEGVTSIPLSIEDICKAVGVPIPIE